MKKSKSIKLNFIMNVILTMSSDNISVCFQNFAAGRNGKGFICNIVDFLFFDVCTVGYSYIRHPCLCKGTR